MKTTGSVISTLETDEVQEAIQTADRIIIGAGSGLSAAAGLLYMDFSTFRAWFPGYHEKYGIRYIYEATFYPFSTPEENFAFWARHINKVRFEFPAGKPYLDLLSLIKEKNYFVLTTNVDSQFYKAGFDKERIWTPQGDYAFFQCSRPCSTELYGNELMVREMLANMEKDSFSIRTEDVPRCPHCGSLLEPNIRKGDNFVETPWMEKHTAFLDFINGAKQDSLLLLELGAGFNTPGIIRYPFEQIAAKWKNARLIRINRDDAGLSIPQASERTKIIKDDLLHLLDTLVCEEPSVYGKR
ncbi:Sir2 silent information regulator family NAD-dependent deacetylase [Brucepastera parasyntrophica]|uniref:SIR2 family NAD-dependent protein deacylase n=1 Tax=Brucepastera parasyntrophica TaxID=2880008 RepID=UPI00210AF31D|nr:Sir2 family NAD-dependent protein deacetylase [Brucepastera parasyntrophica]ULQ60980.1 Sir2 silent information regulator family NAD-dependent deacetylase [Brucepastera parasyntrophica]